MSSRESSGQPFLVIMISKDEADLFSLPTRMGGLGVRDPMSLTEVRFQASQLGSKVIMEYLSGKEEEFLVADHYDIFGEKSSEKKLEQQVADEKYLDVVLKNFDELKVRAIWRAIEGKCSNWLNVVPVSIYGFVLSEREFRDAIAIRYKKPLVEMPGFCDGCGAPTDVSHALSCRKGGLVIRRLNDIRDSLGDLMAMGFNGVLKEPIVRNGDGDSPGLVADLAVSGLWQSQTEALFDVRVIDTDAESHQCRSVQQVLRSAEEEKKLKYSEAVEVRRGSFTPFVVSVDGFMGQEADRSLRRLAEVLVWKWEKLYSSVINWIRAYMNFAIIKATILCLRGSRIKWRVVAGPGFDDGGVLPLC